MGASRDGVARLPRRSFLKAATGATLALPFLESRQSRAAAAQVPLRFVIYQSGQGTLPALWLPPTMPGDALQLSPMLAPLAAHQAKLLVVSGISNPVAALHQGSGHVTAGHTLMNSALIDTTRTGAFDHSIVATLDMLCLGPSIDHALANKLGLIEPINLGIGGASGSENAMFYKVKAPTAQGANPVAPLEKDPVKAFNTQLGSLTAGPAPVPSRADLFKAQRGSVLDAVQGSFKQLTANVSAADRIRLQMHADALRAIEQKLSYVPPMTCSGVKQTLPAGYVLPVYPDYARMDLAAEALMDVAVSALACGANRIVTLQETIYDQPKFDFLPVGPVMGWHAQVHNDPSLGLGYSDPAMNPTLKAGFLYYATAFSKLLDRMDAVVEANGKTMLDNSLVVWISEFGDGRVHSPTKLPVVIAGGAQGQIVTNRHLPRPTATIGDLWTTVLHAFGLPDTSFGYNDKPGLNNGPIAGILT
jgi:hypothetical protein